MELATAALSAPPPSCYKGGAIGLFKHDLSRRNCLLAGPEVSAIGWCGGLVEARFRGVCGQKPGHSLGHARLFDVRLWGVVLLGFGDGWRWKARGRDGWVGAWLWEVIALGLGDGRRSGSVGSAGLVGAWLWGVVACGLCNDRRREILDDLALDDLPHLLGGSLTFLEDLTIEVCFVLGRGGTRAHRLGPDSDSISFARGKLGTASGERNNC